MDTLNKIWGFVANFLKASSGGVANHRKLALLFALIAFIYTAQTVGNNFIVKISQPLAKNTCISKAGEEGCEGGGGTTTTTTPSGTEGPSPTPGHTHTPPIATDRNIGEFQNCFSYDTFDSALKPGGSDTSGNNTFAAGSGNIVNSRKFRKLVYGGNVVNNCQESVHFLFFGAASDRAGSNPKQMGDGDLPDNAFKRLNGDGYLLDFPGKIERQSDQPFKGKWRIEYDTKSRNCGRVGAFSAWRRFNLDPKTGDVEHSQFDHPKNGVKQDFPLFNAVFDYGVDCVPGQNTKGVPPNPAFLKVTCASTRATLSWNIPTGAISNSILRNINNAGAAFIPGIGATQVSFVDTIDPNKFYQWTHKSSPNVKSNTVSCGNPTGGPAVKVTATCEGLTNPKVTIKWTIASGATQNIIDKRLPGNQFGTLPAVLTQTQPPFQTMVVDTAVSLDKTYEYGYRSGPGAISGRVTIPVALNTCNGQEFPIAGCNIPPPPNHLMDFGYYYTDSRYGDHRSEVKDFTNLYLGGYSNYSPDDSKEVWVNKLKQDLADASSDGRKIYLMLDTNKSGTDIDEILNAAKPFWERVAYVDMGDEPDYTKSEMESKISNVKAKITALGLPQKPIGAVFEYRDVLVTDTINASNLDWVGIEAYGALPAPGSANSQTNIDKLNQQFEQARARVSSSKKIVMIMQAYSNPSGIQWPNISTLKDLQMATYYLAYNDSRVIALTMFSYSRPGGSRDIIELRKEHRKMAQAMGLITNACSQ